MSILLRGKKSLSQLARAILRSFGSDAHSYPFSTRQGAYQDTGAITPSVAVNDPIGLQQDTVGTNNATQTTAINRPTVQQDGGGRWYASFNGTNQSMQLASVPFQMADDFAVVACVKYGAPVAWLTIFSLSGAGVIPRIQLLLNEVNGFALAYFQDDAGVNTQAQGAVDLSNTTSVITLAKRGTNVYLRVNGVQVATTSVAGLGAATFTAAAIGRLALGADYMLGGIYDLNLTKGTVTDAQLLVLEKAAAQKAGLVL